MPFVMAMLESHQSGSAAAGGAPRRSVSSDCRLAFMCLGAGRSDSSIFPGSCFYWMRKFYTWVKTDSCPWAGLEIGVQTVEVWLGLMGENCLGLHPGPLASCCLELSFSGVWTGGRSSRVLALSGFRMWFCFMLCVVGKVHLYHSDIVDCIRFMGPGTYFPCIFLQVKWILNFKQLTYWWTFETQSNLAWELTFYDYLCGINVVGGQLRGQNCLGGRPGVQFKHH